MALREEVSTPKGADRCKQHAAPCEHALEPRHLFVAIAEDIFTAKGDPIVISGNHGGRVGEGVYPRSRVLAYVTP
jgi:hypothetical protein